MTVAWQYGDAIFATIKRDAIIYFSYRMRFVSQVLATLLTVTMFYYVAKLVRPGVVGPRDEYFAFVLVGLLGFTVLTSALTVSAAIRLELVQGSFERVLISPLGPVGGVVGSAIFPIIYSGVSATITLVLAVAMFDVPVNIAGILPAVAVAMLGALALGCIGLVFVGALIAFKSSMGMTWVRSGLGLLGGVYFPAKLFPGWIRWVSDVQPLTPAIDLTRHLLVRTPLAAPIWVELTKLTGFTMVLLPLCVVVLWTAVGFSRRRGTIMEF